MLQKVVISPFRTTEIIVATRSFASLIIDSLDVKGVSQTTMLVIHFFNMYSIIILTLVSHFEDHDQNKTYNNLEYSLNLHRDSVGIRDTMYRFCQFQEILQRPLGQCAGGNVGKAC